MSSDHIEDQDLMLSVRSRVRLRVSLIALLLSGFFACEDDRGRTRDAKDQGILSGEELSATMDVADMGARLDMSADPSDSTLDLMPHPTDLSLDEDLSMIFDRGSEPCGGDANPCDDLPQVEIAITAPADQAQLSTSDAGTLQAMLRVDNLDPRAIGIYLTSSLQGPVEISYRPETLTVTSDLNQLTRGTHLLTLSAFVHPDFEWSTQLTVHVPCVIEADFSEALDPLTWYQMGDAYRAEGGWLEMTDQTPSSVGGIFLVGAPIQAATLDVSFKLSVEAELNFNVPLNEQISDGLAMTFWKLPPSAIPVLDPILTRSGSRMGYSLYRDMLAEAEAAGTFTRPEAFTVEFDTYYNTCARNPHQDPTPDPHIAITYDGYLVHPHHTTDAEGNSVEIPTDEICDYPPPSDDPDHPWAAIPNLLDGAWHDVRIQIIDGDLIVTYDGVEKIRSAEIVNRFKGGILAFSGGSGAVPAHLRFDDLVLNSACE